MEVKLRVTCSQPWAATCPQEGLSELGKSKFKCVLPLLKPFSIAPHCPQERIQILLHLPRPAWTDLWAPVTPPPPFPLSLFSQEHGPHWFSLCPLHEPCPPSPPPHTPFPWKPPLPFPSLRLNTPNTPCQAEQQGDSGCGWSGLGGAGGPRSEVAWVGAITEGLADQRKAFTLNELGAVGDFVQRDRIWLKIPLAFGEWLARAKARRPNILNQN